jgi:hypothetical protein
MQQNLYYMVPLLLLNNPTLLSTVLPRLDYRKVSGFEKFLYVDYRQGHHFTGHDGVGN